jgi:bifunctional oligoribonuclease and PAP phosphatase NrnA
MQSFFTDSAEKLQEFEDLFASPKKIIITTHQNPDADALGSSLGMAGYLIKKGHQVTVITPTEYPDFLAWMSGNDNVLDFEKYQHTAKAKAKIADADVIFCLDFSALNRIKNMENLVKKSSAKKILIDHHQQPEDFADFVFWNDHAAATCELIFEMIEQLGDKNLIDIAIAECLYSGLVTDTGSFRFDSTTKEVHRIAGELIEIGINVNKIHRQIFDSNSFERLQFLGYVLGQKLVHLPEFRTAYFMISEEELKRFSSKTGDTEGIVNYALSIKGVVLAVIFTDRGDMIRMSFRSVDDFSVSDFARKYFSGGGHKNAAGGRSNKSLEKTVEQFLSLLPQHKVELLAVGN